MSRYEEILADSCSQLVTEYIVEIGCTFGSTNALTITFYDSGKCRVGFA